MSKMRLFFYKLNHVFENVFKLMCVYFRLNRIFSHVPNRKFSNSESANVDLSTIALERIRNFSIIAHVDHGKSTLADRFLEMTGSIETGNNQQILDKLQVERERGITVKAQTASLLYNCRGTLHLLNLIDTPGHIDFSNEVYTHTHACTYE